MIRIRRIAGILAVALVATVVLSVLTPACAMVGCRDNGTTSCGGFASACDKCPTHVVMKHTSDDAVVAASADNPPLALVAFLPVLPAPEATWRAALQPAATAAPPPGDPLGVRLTI